MLNLAESWCCQWIQGLRYITASTKKELAEAIHHCFLIETYGPGGRPEWNVGLYRYGKHPACIQLVGKELRLHQANQKEPQRFQPQCEGYVSLSSDSGGLIKATPKQGQDESTWWFRSLLSAIPTKFESHPKENQREAENEQRIHSSAKSDGSTPTGCWNLFVGPALSWDS